MDFTLIRRLTSIRHLMKPTSTRIVIALVLTMLSSSVVLADTYDLNITQWQIDIRDQNAGLFYDYLSLSYFLDTTQGTFIYGWQGTFLHPYDSGGPPGNGEFTQIGIMSGPQFGFAWVFESERPIKACLRGSTPFVTGGPLTGCAGVPGDLVNMGESNPVALYHDVPNGQWVAYVYDNHGHSGPVAYISDTGYSGQQDNQIYTNMQVAAERYDSTGINQNLLMSFYYFAPAYGSAGFWPSGNQGANDYLQITPPPNPGCNYGGIFNLSGDGHAFYLGTNGNTCFYTFYY